MAPIVLPVEMVEMAVQIQALGLVLLLQLHLSHKRCPTKTQKESARINHRRKR